MKKKNKKVEPSIPIGTMKIVKEWNPDTAEYDYTLYERDWFPSIGVYGSSFDFWKSIASGNLAWAKKNAAHYKIEIEEGSNN